MTRTQNWKAALLGGALALGMTWASAPTASAQEANSQDGQQAAAQDQGGRRGRGQGRGGQGGPGGGFGNPARAVEQYQAQVMALDLTADQKSKLETIFSEQSEKAKTLAAEVESLQGRERAEKVMPFQREMREKVNGVLTEEQRQTLRKNQAANQAKQMTERYRRATADLNLSDDQKTRLDAVLADTEKKIAETMSQAGAGGGATDGQGGGRGGFGGGQFREINQETRDKINALLNDEQKPKFEEAMQQRGGRGGQGGGRGRGQGGN